MKQSYVRKQGEGKANVSTDTHSSDRDEGIMGLTPDKGETLASICHPGTADNRSLPETKAEMVKHRTINTFTDHLNTQDNIC